jgi:hypothetical protein
MIPENSLNELLLAHMVYDKGENFGEIASALSKHPLLKDQLSRRVVAKVSSRLIMCNFKPSQDSNTDCEELYNKLLVREGLERSESDSSKIPPWVDQLARVLYSRYVKELVKTIEKDEQDFKTVFQELEKLKQEAADAGESVD